MLTYGGSSLTEKIPFPVSLKIIIASLLMLLYDIVLEQIAPVIGMWYWEDSKVPLRNYFAWFVIASVFQTFIRITGVKTRNSIVLLIFIVQVVFFILLVVFIRQ